MKNLRGLIQTYILILAGAVHTLIILRIAVDFTEYPYEDSFIKIFYNLSSTILLPFKDITIPALEGNEYFNVAAVLGLITYTSIVIFVLKLNNIILKEDGRDKVKSLINVGFAFLEWFFVLRLGLTILKAEEKSFYKLITSITSIFTLPLQHLLPEAQDEQTTQAVVLLIVIVLIGIFWYTLIKLYDGIQETKDTAYEPYIPQKPAPHKPDIKKQQPQQTVQTRPEQEVTTKKEGRKNGPGININLRAVKAKIKELFKFEPEEEIKTPFEKQSKIKKKKETTKSPLG